MREFFQNPEVADDPVYRRVCKTDTSLPEAQVLLEQARGFVERMWEACGQFIDSDAPERARQEFNPVWWELYLAYCLHNAGISLVARADRIHQGPGRPDLLTENPRVWIEAVMPKSGDGPDALVEPPPGKVFRVPTDAYVLRLLTAIQEKARKFKNYIEEGTIPSGDATIIAVSGGRLPFRYTEPPIPSIARALLGVGSPVLEIDAATKTVAGHYVEHRDQIEKQSGSLVPTDVFLRKEYAHVSAVLYSSSDCVNHPQKPGQDFILIYNPNALVRVPNGWLLVGDQYWIEADA